MPEITMIPLDDIGFEAAYYPRVNADANWFTVNQYWDAYQQGANFPPIALVRVTKRPYPFLSLDGRHRYLIHRKAKQTKIAAEILKLPEKQWFAKSVELNARHGRQLDPGDKAWIGYRLKQQGYSLKRISKILCMDPVTLERLILTRVVEGLAEMKPKKGEPPKKESRSYRRVNGKFIGVLKKALDCCAGSASAKLALQKGGPLTQRDNLQIMDAFLAVLECKTIDLADAEQAARFEKIKAMVRKY
jgi:hypothetical protein